MLHKKKENLCCEGEWQVCVCLLNKTSTVEQHIFSTEAKRLSKSYSLILPVCHKKTGFAYPPFSTAEAKVFLHWPVYNYSVIMRRRFKKKTRNTFWYCICFGFVYFCFFFYLYKWALQLCWNQCANPAERWCNITGFSEELLLQFCNQQS